MAIKWQTTLVAIVLVIAYAIVGGVIFRYIELDNETAVRQQVNQELPNYLGDFT
jgi:hypothetical protein